MNEPCSPARTDFQTRQMDVLAAVLSHSAEAILVTDLDNVFYLSGFSGSNGALALHLDGPATLVTDARYRDQALAQCRHVQVVIDKETTPRALRVAAGQGAGTGRARADAGTATDKNHTGVSADRNVDARDEAEAGLLCDFADSRASSRTRRVAFEADHLSYSVWQSLSGIVAAGGLIPTSGLIESRRRRKDAGEIVLIESACHIAEKALSRTTAAVRPGMTEREVARGLDFAMLEGGADDRAFDTIVASGPNSAIPHHSPTEREIAVGDLLKIDFGARLGGYHSDITRTFVVGAEPSTEQMCWHNAVARAATAARESLVAGVSAASPYRSAHNVLTEHGFADAFTHGLGHGVGLEIHEAPIMTANCGDTLVVDDVLTVEPGVYFPGVGGVRIEDTLVVTETGSRSLTTVPRDLVRLG